MGLDESYINFYIYNIYTKVMKLVELPFEEPQPIDMVNKKKASNKVINSVTTARNEDANKYQPCYSLPRSGKNITFRMADRNAIPKSMQRERTLIWNGREFYLQK